VETETVTEDTQTAVFTTNSRKPERGFDLLSIVSIGDRKSTKLAFSSMNPTPSANSIGGRRGVAQWKYA
jgi:hypothetical protein